MYVCMYAATEVLIRCKVLWKTFGKKNEYGTKKNVSGGGETKGKR